MTAAVRANRQWAHERYGSHLSEYRRWRTTAPTWRIAVDIDGGPCVGDVTATSSRVVTAAEMAVLLTQAGWDPAFFSLDDDGQPTDQ